MCPPTSGAGGAWSLPPERRSETDYRARRRRGKGTNRPAVWRSRHTAKVNRNNRVDLSGLRRILTRQIVRNLFHGSRRRDCPGNRTFGGTEPLEPDRAFHQRRHLRISLRRVRALGGASPRTPGGRFVGDRRQLGDVADRHRRHLVPGAGPDSAPRRLQRLHGRLRPDTRRHDAVSGVDFGAGLVRASAAGRHRHRRPLGRRRDLDQRRRPSTVVASWPSTRPSWRPGSPPAH